MLWGWSFHVWETIVKVSLWIAVGAGVLTAVTAFVAGYVGYELTDVVQKEADVRIGEASAQGKAAVAEAAKANAELGKAQIAIEQAQARAAEAGARAAEAQLALEIFKAPRSMTRPQQDEIIAAIAQFKGTRFDMAVLPGDPEAANFLGQVSAAMQLAEWEWVEWAHPNNGLTFTYSWPNLPNVGQMGGFGIDIFVSSQDEKLLKAAMALAAVLVSKNWSSLGAREAVKEQGIPNADTVHVVIGRKIP